MNACEQPAVDSYEWLEEQIVRAADEYLMGDDHWASPATSVSLHLYSLHILREMSKKELSNLTCIP